MNDDKEYMHLELTEENPVVSSQAIELKFSVPWGYITGKGWGDPCGQPVLCIHGIQDNAGTFDHLIPQLPPLFYYVCIDLPGHGFSSHFPEGLPLNFLDYILSLLRVLNILQWENCYYIGHSLGGQLGVYLSSLWPERIKKLIVIDAVAPNTVDTKQFLSRNEHTINKVLTGEEKFSGQTSPSYSYKEALKRMIANRRSELTLVGAKTLIKRSLLKNEDGGFSFTADQRLKEGVWPLFNTKQQLQILGNVTCPVLGLLTDIPKISNVWKPAKVALEKFSTKQNFQRIDVEGNHDVHLNNPERIAPLISKFLTTRTCSL